MTLLGIFCVWLACQEPGPLSPERSLEQLVVRPGLRVELVAAEPLVRDPISIAFGFDGRLWVVEMGDYPQHEASVGGGRVCVLDDVDGDGRYDRSTVFVDDLVYPNSVLPWRDGAIICCPPEIFFARDRDGDGRADERQVLFSGLAEGNPQHRVNGLRWGIDNWVYCSNGDNGGSIRSERTAQPMILGTSDLRIRPDTGETDRLTGTSQFSRCQDDWGNRFGGNNAAPIWHIVLRDQDVRAGSHGLVAGRRSFLAGSTTRLKSLIPNQPRLNQPEAVDRFTASCGLDIYRDSWLGPDWVNAFVVCEPAHQLVHAEPLRRSGVTFEVIRSRQEDQPELLASRDPWFRPVQARTGPDGAIWVVDMYRQVIEHPEYIPQRNRQGLDFTGGRSLGRIYRIVPEDSQTGRVAWPRLDQMSAEELVATFEHANGTLRDMAQQQLLHTCDSTIVPALRQLLQSSPLPQARLHALSTLEELDPGFDQLLLGALGDEHPEVRRNAVMFCQRHEPNSPEINQTLQALAGDPSAAVQLQVALALGPRSDQASKIALARIAFQHCEDPFFVDGLLSAPDEQLPELLNRLLEHPDLQPRHSPLLSRLMVATWRVKQWSTLKTSLNQLTSEAEPRDSAWRLQTLADFLSELRRANTSLDQLNEQSDEELVTTLSQLQPLLQDSRQIALDTNASLTDRRRAINLLGQNRTTIDLDVETLRQLLVPQTPATLQHAAVEVLEGIRRSDTGEILLSAWSGFTPPLRRQVIEVVLQRPDWTRTLLDQVESNQVSPTSIAAVQQQLLLQHRFPDIRQRSSQIFAAPDTDRTTVIATYQTALTQTGDPQRGKAVYQKSCAQCHDTAGKDVSLAPDLRELIDRSDEQLLQDILDPNRAVEPRFLQYTAELVDGATISGLIVSESRGALGLVDVQGKLTVVPRESIVVLESGPSLMPTGLEAEVSPDQMRDLLAYLRSSR